METIKRLGKQIFVYGLATVLPRALSFLLLPLYTSTFEQASGYGQYVFIYSWIAFFNVILSYGMETAFFRHYHKSDRPEQVLTTSIWSLTASSLLLFFLGITFYEFISEATGINAELVKKTVYILILDALVVIPFAYLRAQEQAAKYALVKSINVLINVGLNVYYLKFSGTRFLGNEIDAIFEANIIASAFTLFWMLPIYFKYKPSFDYKIYKQLLRYAIPVMFAGIAFTINEVFDKIILTRLAGETEAGIYGACYKLGVFMTLFATAYRMGVEPFFFREAKKENREKRYADVTYFFVALSSIIYLGVMVFLKPIAHIFLRDEVYREGLVIVPFVLLGALFLGVYHNLSVWYKITDRTYVGAIISGVGALITLGVNSYLIPHIGYIAAAIGTLSAYGLMMLISFLWGLKIYPIPYRVIPMLGYLLVSVSLSLVHFFFFSTSLVAALLFLLLFSSFVILIERSTLKRLFTSHGTH
jgi:O-antigen/teichoic acid export membrane protein